MKIMKCHFLSMAIVLGMALGADAAWADQEVQFARDKQCLACHQVDARRVGPAFSVIAERYANAPGAQQYLSDAIRQGSRSKWGAIPMPAQPQVSELDAARLTAWILSLAKKVDH